MAITGKDISKARQLLEKGELVAIPTETVYGLAANCLDARAVARIFEAKKRPYFDPLIIHLPDIELVKNYVEEIPEMAYKLAMEFWPGPLTLLLPKKEIIPDIVTSGLDTVAVRIPRHPLTLELLRTLDFPLAAPSANPFGYVSPTKPEHVEAQLGEALDYILDGGSCKVGIESTIVGFEDGKTVINRLGGLSVEQIKTVTGSIEIKPHSDSNPVAPGMLKSHYAPSTSIILGNIEQLMTQYQGQNFGVISYNKSFLPPNSPRQFVLSEESDIQEAATRLFSGLRQLDSLNLQFILAEFVPEAGLGRAINDRLQRASVKRI